MYKRDGSLFVGMFDKGNAVGRGFYFLPDGTYFEGKILDNMINDDNAYIQKGEMTYRGSVMDN